MKYKNIELVGFDNILSQYSEKKLPQKISYAITKNIMILGKELEAYQKTLAKIIESYDKFIIKNEKGENVILSIGIPKVDDEHIDEYLKDVDELLDIETEVEMYQVDDTVFDYDDSERFDAMSAKDIITLRSILCKGNENEKAK